MSLSSPFPFPWRSIAFWLSALIAVMMAFNAWQAFADPAAFAARFADAADAMDEAGPKIVFLA